MKKGISYISISDEDKNHSLIKELNKKGIYEIELIYASHWATDAGWTMVKSTIGAVWLGFTKKEAIKTIMKL
jgi:hypothetical protein